MRYVQFINLNYIDHKFNEISFVLSNTIRGRVYLTLLRLELMVMHLFYESYWHIHCIADDAVYIEFRRRLEILALDRKAYFFDTFIVLIKSF